MKLSILTIGDELLIGQVLNSNAQWAAEQFTAIGWDVACQLTVGDQLDEIMEGLALVCKKSDAVLISGGLGPTHDDLTMEALSKFLKVPLEMDHEWVGLVEEFFRSRKRAMPANNQKQGLLLKGAVRIDNDCGTAAGQHIRHGNTDLFVVPGVPHEMKSMLNRVVLPALAARSGNTGGKILKETLLTTGIGESALAERLDPVVKKIRGMPEFTLAFLPSTTMVRLRLLMKASNSEDQARFQALVQELQQACGKDYFGMEPATLEGTLVGHLKSLGKTLAIAESCTGGLVSHRITQVPGASSVLRGSMIAYQEEIKTLELAIPAEDLRRNGMVSEFTARAMAEAIRRRWNADYGLSTTGYLGPTGGDEHAALGTVWIALATPAGTIAREFRYEPNRERAKERAAQSALDLLRRNSGISEN